MIVVAKYRDGELTVEQLSLDDARSLIAVKVDLFWDEVFQTVAIPRLNGQPTPESPLTLGEPPRKFLLELMKRPGFRMTPYLLGTLTGDVYSLNNVNVHKYLQQARKALGENGGSQYFLITGRRPSYGFWWNADRSFRHICHPGPECPWLDENPS